MLGIQNGVAILDIEKAHLSHVSLLRPFGKRLSVILNQVGDAYY